MKLHFRKIGDQGQPLVILHGLFGSSDNWQTLGKHFAEHFQVYLVDQRNHGRSPKSDEFSYKIMSDDLHQFIVDEKIESPIILGHSMGGKAAMKFANEYPNLLDKLIVADIGPKKYPLHHQQILAGLNAIDLNVVKSRSQADRILTEYIPEVGVKQFLLKNLYWEEKGKLGWRINIPVLSAKIETICDEIVIDQSQTKTLFIRGAKSNYIVESDFDLIHQKFPNSEILTIDNAGHWIHAEAPKVFFEMVLKFGAIQ